MNRYWSGQLANIEHLLLACSLNLTIVITTERKREKGLLFLFCFHFFSPYVSWLHLSCQVIGTWETRAIKFLEKINDTYQPKLELLVIQISQLNSQFYILSFFFLRLFFEYLYPLALILALIFDLKRELFYNKIFSICDYKLKT